MTSRFDRVMQRHFVTSEDILGAASRGETRIAVRENATVTDEARELAMKLSIRLDAPEPAGPPGAAVATNLRTAEAVAPALVPEDAGLRVAEAIAAVLNELKLGERGAALVPVLTRRVFAGLASAAARK